MFGRGFKQTKSVKERLLEEARKLREEARLLPFGPDRDAASKKPVRSLLQRIWMIG